MRPRYLEIEGLQSFTTKQKINFDELGETGLFGIFGPTGSGKSTVLDAITLALYGEVNRALSGTQGIINSRSNSIKVLFAFDLKKHDGYKSYRVERQYQRKKNSDNSCEAKVARLVLVTENGDLPLADKARDVTAKVEELIGLRHDDFMRAVVLPQNKFQEFLMLEKSRKREMLERIFYLEEYGKQLTEKVSARLNAVKDKLLVTRGELQALRDASDDELEKSENNLKEAQLRCKKANAEFKRAEEEFNKAKEIWQLVNDLQVIEDREKEHLKSSEKIQADIELLERANKAKSLEGTINRYESTLKNYEEVVAGLKPLEELLSGLERELSEAKVSRDGAIIEANARKQQLIERRMNLNNAMQLKNEVSVITADMDKLRELYFQVKNEITASEKKIKEKQNSAEMVSQELQNKKKQLSLLTIPSEHKEKVRAAARLEESLLAEKKQLQEDEVLCRELHDKVGKLNQKLSEVNAGLIQAQAQHDEILAQQSDFIGKMPCDRETAALNTEKYHELKAAAVMLLEKKKGLESSITRINELRQEIQRQGSELNKQTECREALYKDKELLENSVAELQELLHKNAAYMLAAGLKEGDPCPVCGSTRHPLPAAASEHAVLTEIEDKLKIYKERLIEVENNIKAAESKCAVLTEQLRLNRITAEQLEKDEQAAEDVYLQEFAEITTKLHQHFKDQAACEAYAEATDALAGTGQDIEKLLYALNKIADGNLQLLASINEWESKTGQLKKQAEDAAIRVSELKTSAGSLQAELKVNYENLTASENKVKAMEAAYNDKKLQYAEMTAKLGIQSAIKESAEIAATDAEAETLRTELDSLELKLAALMSELEADKSENRKFTEKLAEYTNDGKHLKEQKENREAKILELAGNCDIEKELLKLDENLIQIEQNSKMLDDKVEMLDAKVKEFTNRKNTLEGQKNVLAESLSGLKRELDAMLSEKGFENIAEARNNIIPDERARLIAENITAYQKMENNIKAQKDMLQKKLDGRSISEKEWEAIKEDYGIKQAEKEESTSSYEIAKNVLSTLHQKNIRWKILNEEQKKAEHLAGLLEHIKNLLKGNSFIEFIAEERLRYIAREATETLGIMTRFRYALELDSDNGFIIRDNSNGGVHRPVTSLSGGEIFLTSLSLALALSNQIHLKGQSPLEFFFLDEGFGTLDSNLLDQVVDSLERISTKERIIGLISHVPELRVRINRRLIVEPPDQEGNGSRVHVEKA